jgi:hypothetical protein
MGDVNLFAVGFYSAKTYSEFGNDANVAFGDFGFIVFELLLLSLAQSFAFEADMVSFAEPG